MQPETFQYAIGADMGATNIRAALVRSDGQILKLVRKTDAVVGARMDIQDRFQQIGALVREVIASPEAAGLALRGIGVGSAGQVNREGVIVGHSRERDFNFQEMPVLSILRQSLGLDLPVYIDNDAKVAAWGEYLYGAGRGTRSMVCVTVGTGVGGGVVIDGRLLHGATGLGGHLGFVSVDMHGPLSLAGARGIVEDYASGSAIGLAARNALEAGRASRVVDMAGGNIQAVTSDIVFDARDQGDALAQEVIDNAAYALGIAISSLVHIFEPDVVVMGGGVCERGEVFLAPVRRTVQENSMRRFGRIPIIPAQLGNRAGVAGAAALAFTD